jgi:YVTN family beta-propeller protein
MGARRSGIHQLIAIPSLRVVLGAVLLFWLVGTTCRNGNLPDTPQAPVGPTRWPVGLADTFSVTTYDPEGDRVRYVFDWGDGTQDSTGYCDVGVPVRAWHAWTTGGTHPVKARAYDLQGHGSDWSEATPVTIVGFPHRVVATIPVGSCAGGVVIPPGREFAYVTICYTDTVRVIRTSDDSVVATVILPGGPDGCNPMGITALPNGEYLYVACYTSGLVAVVRTLDNAVVAAIPVGYGACDVEALADGRRVYVTLDGEVRIIRTSDNTVEGTIDLGNNNAHGLGASPDGEFVYVANGSCNLVPVIRTTDNRVVHEISVSPEVNPVDVSVLPSGEYLYVANGVSNTVSVVRTASDSVVKTLPVGDGPSAFGVMPEGQFAYIANRRDGTVTVVRTADHVVASTIRSVGDGPRGVAVFPDGERVYVADYRDGSIIVLGH